MPSALPILYSFRRCPYAIRARLALTVSAQSCELREVVLRDKPLELLSASPKGTVPVLVDVDAGVIAESLDIMLWTLQRNDPAQWLSAEQGSLRAMLELIGRCDDEFKYHLDRYKYPDRHPDAERDTHRNAGAEFLHDLNAQLGGKDYLFGNRPALADMAIAPFVRQFASTDVAWFDSQPWTALHRWLAAFTQSALFERVMRKYPRWQPGTTGVTFPESRIPNPC
jgi:glutathione S-transferase